MICYLPQACSQKNNGEVHSHLRCFVEKLLCPKSGKFGLTTRVLCAVLPEQDTLQGASANRMDTQQHVRLDGITTLPNSLLQMGKITDRFLIQQFLQMAP